MPFALVSVRFCGQSYVSQCIKSIVARHLLNYISSFKHGINFATTSSSVKVYKTSNTWIEQANSKYFSRHTMILHYEFI